MSVASSEMNMGIVELSAKCDKCAVERPSILTTLEAEVSPGQWRASLPPELLKLLARAPSTYPGELWYKFLKRTVDIVLSIALLIVALPLLIGTALLVRLTSRGPAFYTQVRWGLGGRPFKIIKFRSMVSDADQHVDEMEALAEARLVPAINAPAFKSPDDPRVTRVGRILRRTCIDELPQLINVLAGQMSFVGPRPLVEREALGLSPDDCARRHSVRPGLSCLWQVIRVDDTTFSERMELDLAYVENASGMLDLAVMAMTPSAIAVGRGSY